MECFQLSRLKSNYLYKNIRVKNMDVKAPFLQIQLRYFLYLYYSQCKMGLDLLDVQKIMDTLLSVNSDQAFLQCQLYKKGKFHLMRLLFYRIEALIFCLVSKSNYCIGHKLSFTHFIENYVFRVSMSRWLK